MKNGITSYAPELSAKRKRTVPLSKIASESNDHTAPQKQHEESSPEISRPKKKGRVSQKSNASSSGHESEKSGAVTLTSETNQAFDFLKICQVIVYPYSSLAILSSRERIAYGRIHRYIKKRDRENSIAEDLSEKIKAFFPELFSAIPTSIDNLNEVYLQLRAQVEDASRQAKQAGKKLLVFAGEAHSSLNALLLQCMLINIVKKFDTKSFLIEFPEDMLGKFSNPITVDAFKNFNLFYSAPYAVKEELNLVFSDLNVKKRTTHDDFLEREPHLEKVILDKNQNMLLVWGIGHLEFILNNNKLAAQYHILALDLRGYTPEARDGCRFVLNGKMRDRLEFADAHPFLSRPQILGNIELLTPEEIVETVEKISARNNLVDDDSNEDISDPKREMSFVEVADDFLTLLSGEITPRIARDYQGCLAATPVEQLLSELMQNVGSAVTWTWNTATRYRFANPEKRFMRYMEQAKDLPSLQEVKSPMGISL
ncbi:MAG: hypothetical protein BGO43_00765 [Gammaproteobacteria bacterium 39-13]|nr:hypothetical protein [Gammaproteobacteria bacterium]OJV96787.1 MAG: hypothetical protein BGO43_00765 [Gammaproteobacteria bacterium 39-13]